MLEMTLIVLKSCKTINQSINQSIYSIPVSCSESGWYPSYTVVDRSLLGTTPGLKGDNAHCHSLVFYL